ncbi:MAG: helix-turn-helix transcriptional regulator [Lachnospiraceae bacterium]|nr:helix-turn-helix transcriptional regulator [Lachnospiraceae bacterium]
MLGERIRSRRMELCMSQEALAEKAGISANTVSRIEGGQMSVTIGIFIKLVQALDTDADRLLGILPEAGRKQYREIFYRISHLRAGEQEIVLRTVETLVEELHRNR